MKYKYIFWDFNGTILDDVELCLVLLNDMLKKRNLPLVSKDKYLHIFGFPVIEYYKRAGLTFENESFESMAVDFIDKYQPASYACSLYSGIKELLAFNKAKGISYNITDGGDGTIGIYYSDRHKEQISISLKNFYKKHGHPL